MTDSKKVLADHLEKLYKMGLISLIQWESALSNLENEEVEFGYCYEDEEDE